VEFVKRMPVRLSETGGHCSISAFLDISVQFLTKKSLVNHLLPSVFFLAEDITAMKVTFLLLMIRRFNGTTGYSRPLVALDFRLQSSAQVKTGWQ